MKLPLTYFGNPILRKKGAKVEKFDQELRQLVADMEETLEEHSGIGLAAPQINRSLRLFITKVPIPTEDKEGEWEEGPLLVFINPILSNPSPEKWVYSEGCLSIPGIYTDVERPYKITVEAQDLEGNTFKETYQGLQARCIMHENDHINGVLIIDRINGKKRQEIEPLLKKIKTE